MRHDSKWHSIAIGQTYDIQSRNKKFHSLHLPKNLTSKWQSLSYLWSFENALVGQGRGLSFEYSQYRKEVRYQFYYRQLYKVDTLFRTTSCLQSEKLQIKNKIKLKKFSYSKDEN